MNRGLIIGLVLPLAAADAGLSASAQQPTADPLRSCVSIASASERLACFDKLTSHSPVAAPAPATTTPTGASGSGSLAGSTTAIVATSAASATPIAPAQTAPDGSAAFGLYGAEHPTIPTLKSSLTGKVTDVVNRSDGHQLVTLDGTQVWELDGADGLLAKGNSITIKRAALGSFIATTPTGRSFHAQRRR